VTEPEPQPAACGSDHCITCGDDGIPMTVVRVDAATGLAVCADGAQAESVVEISLVCPLDVGDRVLVHAGVAIAPLEASEAAT
jgi:hydrogenase expression/formation protein HypC